MLKENRGCRASWRRSRSRQDGTKDYWRSWSVGSDRLSRRRGEKNIEERDQVAEQEQNKKVRLAEEKQPEETQEQSTDKQDVGRGSRGLVRGGDERCQANETNRKGKGKGNGGTGEHEGKGGGFGLKGKQQETREEEKELVRMAPNIRACGSHPQATSDPGEEKQEILRLL